MTSLPFAGWAPVRPLLPLDPPLLLEKYRIRRQRVNFIARSTAGPPTPAPTQINFYGLALLSVCVPLVQRSGTRPHLITLTQ